MPTRRIAEDLYSDRYPDRSSITTEPLVSIVVPAYFSASIIEDCLKSLSSQKYLKENLEVIVIDSGNDETKDICRKYDVQYYHSARKLSAGAARNMGAEIAKGQILAFIDADCVAPNQWIWNLINDFDEFPEAFGVLGVYEGGKSNLDKVRGGELMECKKRIDFHRGFIEGNVAFRRKVFEKGCRFGDMTYGECVKLSVELSKMGMKTVWDPALRVFHKGHLTYRKMFAMDRAYARTSLGLENGALTKGLLKLLYITILLVSIPFCPLLAVSLALTLFAVMAAYSLSDNMVSSKHRVNYIHILIAMRLSRFFASAIEAFLHLLKGGKLDD